jgi:hypothetical protein
VQEANIPNVPKMKPNKKVKVEETEANTGDKKKSVKPRPVTRSHVGEAVDDDDPFRVKRSRRKAA